MDIVVEGNTLAGPGAFNILAETKLRWHPELVARHWDYGKRCLLMDRDPKVSEAFRITLKGA
jgi:hypothetical protein